ncbi:MAG: RtcB family protein [Desulfuromonadales bacterium]|nr:RtcB family protein [Desulfuromonadales bacterium]MBN2792987.1 RtcB family protein [Desulfuromonadales bacterium]
MILKPHKIFARDIEPLALEQFYSALSQEYSVRGALMPDAHVGYSLPIGAVIATNGVILPAWVGYDIGCGMCAVPTSFAPDAIRNNAEGIFSGIYRSIPVGFNHNQKPSAWDCSQLPRTGFLDALFRKNGLNQLGSLGSGNHFIEIGADEEQRLWIIIHSGSRNLGHATATHYMKLAAGGKAREGHFGFSTHSKEGKDYIKDLAFCLEFALANRYEIIRRVVRDIQHYCSGEADWKQLINRNHNHTEEKDGLWIHRKGATHAEKGMLGVIPGNMRDGSFIVKGKGNKEALWSSSHGAGRVMGRKAAKRQIKLKQFSDSMVGIVAKVDRQTLDEAPFAYKNIDEVMRLQKDLVTVLHRVRPIINIKG